MHAAPARYVSVSELYSTDEVELLLDEIRELEPTSCRGEDVQDFEIAGSGAGAGAGGRSPVGTERSWDSHAHYSRPPPPRPQPLAPLYCHLKHLYTFRGACSFLILVCGVSVCACVWSGAGARVALPLAGRPRLLLLAALSSALLHAALLIMHVSRLDHLLPIPWQNLGALCCGWSGLALWGGAGGTLHALLAEPAYRWAPPALAALLYAAVGLGFIGGAAAFLVVGRALAEWGARAGSAARSGGAKGAAREGRGSLTYRAVPTAPPPQPLPSTSRDNPL